MFLIQVRRVLPSKLLRIVAPLMRTLAIAIRHPRIMQAHRLPAILATFGRGSFHAHYRITIRITVNTILQIIFQRVKSPMLSGSLQLFN